MAFTGTISVSQLVAESFDLQDTSSYASEGQGTFTGRRITLTKADGTTLVPTGTTTTYIDFPFSGGDTITLDVLDRDYALTILVEWISSAPQSGSTYEKSGLYEFEVYTSQFIYGLIESMTAQPNIINDVNFYTNLSKIQTDLDSSNKAVEYNDITAAQYCLDRCKYMMDNSDLYF